MKYVIKKHYEATETNLNFKGEIRDYFEGRGGELLASDCFPTEGQVEAFGYCTLAGAKMALRKAQELAEWETSHGHWTVTASLVQA